MMHLQQSRDEILTRAMILTPRSFLYRLSELISSLNDGELVDMV